jgi:hypothetical protein
MASASFDGNHLRPEKGTPETHLTVRKPWIDRGICGLVNSQNAP